MPSTGLARGARAPSPDPRASASTRGRSTTACCAAAGCSASRSTTATSAPRAASRRCTRVDAVRRAVPPQRPAVPAVQHAVPVRRRAAPDVLDVADSRCSSPTSSRSGSPARASPSGRTRRRPGCCASAPASGTTSSSTALGICRAASSRRSSIPASVSARCGPRSRRAIGAAPARRGHRGRLARHRLGRRRRADATPSRRLHLVRHLGARRRRARAARCSPTRRARRTSRTRAASTGACGSCTTSWGCGCSARRCGTWERDGDPIDLPTLLDRPRQPSPAPVPVFDAERPALPRARRHAGAHRRVVRASTAPRARARRAEFARSIVESLAQAFADACARRRDASSGATSTTIHIVGGGSLNELLCQRTADRSGLPVLAGPVEATALGNVLVQARAHGFVGRRPRGAARTSSPAASRPGGTSRAGSSR